MKTSVRTDNCFYPGLLHYAPYNEKTESTDREREGVHREYSPKIEVYDRGCSEISDSGATMMIIIGRRHHHRHLHGQRAPLDEGAEWKPRWLRLLSIYWTAGVKPAARHYGFLEFTWKSTGSYFNWETGHVDRWPPVYWINRGRVCIGFELTLCGIFALLDIY